MEALTVIILRSAERLIGVLLGGFLVWLGYRLFLKIPIKSNSSGEFKFPGGTVVHLTRVGPGIFFSLFGTSIMLLSFVKPINFEQSRTAEKLAGSPASGGGNTTLAFHGMGPSTNTASSPRTKDLRNARRIEIQLLNQLAERLPKDLKERDDYVSAIPRIKLAIMELVWDPEWGNFAEFEDCVHKNGDEIPDSFQKAGRYFAAR